MKFFVDMFRSLFVFILLVFPLFSPNLAALEVNDLYQASVIVDSQASKEREHAIKDALQTVFLKIGGKKSVLTHDVLQQAQRRASRYVSQYRYHLKNDQLSIIVRFNENKVNQLFQQANLSIWGTLRPQILLWLVDEQGATRSIIATDAETTIPEVVNDFSNEYFSGRTPNPCIRCNSMVKWDALINQLKVFDADMIATGHYARIKKHKNQYELCKGLDISKDQSYMLWQIDKKYLAKTILPLGELTKKEVRNIALEYNLENAKRDESMDLCFVVDNDYKQFLHEFMPEKVKNIKNGEIVDEKGDKVGTHTGYTNYTIGQRRGLGLSFPEPRYVKKILPLENKLIISKKNGLLSKKASIKNLNWIKEIAKFPFKCKARIRYNSMGADATLIEKNNKLICEFSEPQIAITPGQSMVFYSNDSIVGGGIIEK